MSLDNRTRRGYKTDDCVFHVNNPETFYRVRGVGTGYLIQNAAWRKFHPFWVPVEELETLVATFAGPVRLDALETR